MKNINKSIIEFDHKYLHRNIVVIDVKGMEILFSAMSKILGDQMWTLYAEDC